ncbi:hypothetical protein [Rossellomorea sp. BNER]|uniref:hypothetical protein n=1 Tax=Rossellomorea sp. BNER TaxID=2962031 RepID=UPI003AF217F1|nr:hypothetical protein [Rossellomorea sp. BNER]
MEGNPDDIQLVNQLDRSKAEDWEELRSVAEEMTAEDRSVKWTDGGFSPMERID